MNAIGNLWKLCASSAMQNWTLMNMTMAVPDQFAVLRILEAVGQDQEVACMRPLMARSSSSVIC